MENELYLNVGYIINTRGLKGVLKIKSTSTFAKARYKKGNKLYIYNPKDESRIEVEALTYSNEGDFDYVSFNNLQDINLVEKYVGCSIEVRRDEIPPLPKNTYFFSDLEKCITVDENGNQFGKVKKVEEFTSQLSLRVELPSKKTVLIPYVKYFVKKIDIESKIIVIHVIDGLLD